MYYDHDRVEAERPKTTAFNTAWPAALVGGAAEEWCKEYLEKRRLSWPLAKANGWYPSQDAGDWLTRIVIPAQSTQLGHAYWQARAISPSAFIRYQSPKGPRLDAVVVVTPPPSPYVSSFKWEPVTVLVEGPMDALAVAECGAMGIALMGATPGTTVLRSLYKRLKPMTPVFVMPDRDAVSEGQQTRLALASLGKATRLINLADWTDKKDFAALPPAQRRVILMGAMSEWETEQR